MRARNRLPADTVDLDIDGYSIAVSLAYGPDTGELREMVFVKRPGKEGSHLDRMFQELGVQLSRAIQGRNPATGDEPKVEPIEMSVNETGERHDQS